MAERNGEVQVTRPWSLLFRDAPWTRLLYICTTHKPYMASNSAEETQSDNLSDIWVLTSYYSPPSPEFCDSVQRTVEIPHKPGMWDMELEVPESDEEMRTMRVSLV